MSPATPPRARTPPPATARRSCRVGGHREPAVGGDRPTHRTGCACLAFSSTAPGRRRHRDEYRSQIQPPDGRGSSGPRGRRASSSPPGGGLVALDVPAGNDRNDGPCRRPRCPVSNGATERHQRLACPPDEPWPPSPRVVLLQPGLVEGLHLDKFRKFDTLKTTRAIRSPADPDGLVGSRLINDTLIAAAIAGIDGARTVSRSKVPRAASPDRRWHQAHHSSGIAAASPVGTNSR